MAAEAVLRDVHRREAEEQARTAARTVWARFAEEDGTISPFQLHDVLTALDYGRRTMTLGKGLHRSTIEVAALPSDAHFALEELGITDSDLRCTRTRVPYHDFERWYVRKVLGDRGYSNATLVKPVTGRVKAATRDLPAGDFTYGSSSGVDSSTMHDLLGHRYMEAKGASRPVSPAKSSAVRGPPAPKGAAPPGSSTGGTGVDKGRVYGRPSEKPVPVGLVLTHGHTGDRVVEAEYVAARAGHGMGVAPPPRATVTSTLRAIAAATTTTLRKEEEMTGKPAGESNWKMSRFLNVPPRVPLDGKPLHAAR